MGVVIVAGRDPKYINAPVVSAERSFGCIDSITPNLEFQS